MVYKSENSVNGDKGSSSHAFEYPNEETIYGSTATKTHMKDSLDKIYGSTATKTHMKDSLDNSDIEEESGMYNSRALCKFALTYELEKFHKKLLIIINNKQFNKTNLSRHGTEKDLGALKKTFDAVGFKVFVYNELKKAEIIEKFESISKTDFTDYGCIAIAVLTYGSKNILRAKDHGYDVTDIWKYFKVQHNPTLVTKPRIVIVQACRSKEYSCSVLGQSKSKKTQDHIDEGTQYFMPHEADILTVHSSYKNNSVSKKKLKGSRFIQSLCKQIDNLAATDDFESILMAVKREIVFESQYLQCKRCHSTSSQEGRNFFKNFFSHPGK